MPKTNTVPALQNENFGGNTFNNADGTTSKLIYTAGPNDSLIRSLFICNTDTNPAIVKLYLAIGSDSYLLDTITIPAGAGTDGTTPAVDGLSSDALPILGTKKILTMAFGYVLNAQLVSAVGSGKVLSISALAADY